MRTLRFAGGLIAFPFIVLFYLIVDGAKLLRPLLLPLVLGIGVGLVFGFFYLDTLAPAWQEISTILGR